MYFFFILILVYSNQEFLNQPMENFIRISGYEIISVKNIQNNLISLSSSNNGLFLHQFNQNLTSFNTIFSLIGKNVYEPCMFFYNASSIFLLTLVVINNTSEIPKLKPANPKILSTQVLLIQISTGEYSLISTEFVGNCLQGDTRLLDGYYYSNSILLLLSDTCDQSITSLEIVHYNIYPIKISGNTGRIFIMNSFIYIIISFSNDLTIYKYDFSLTEIWNVTISNITLVDYSLSVNEFIILSSNSFYLFSDSGIILNSISYTNINFTALL